MAPAWADPLHAPFPSTRKSLWSPREGKALKEGRRREEVRRFSAGVGRLGDNRPRRSRRPNPMSTAGAASQLEPGVPPRSRRRRRRHGDGAPWSSRAGPTRPRPARARRSLGPVGLGAATTRRTWREQERSQRPDPSLAARHHGRKRISPRRGGATACQKPGWPGDRSELPSPPQIGPELARRG